MDQKHLWGRWHIVSWEQRYDDGRVTQPLGAHPQGYIQYDPDGRMACLISRGQRPSFTSGGQWDASQQERAQAYSDFLAYGGRYEVHGNEVVHVVDISLYPNWVGGAQRRRVELQSGQGETQLVISARLEDGTPNARTALLVWRRAAT